MPQISEADMKILETAKAMKVSHSVNNRKRNAANKAVKEAHLEEWQAAYDAGQSGDYSKVAGSSTEDRHHANGAWGSENICCNLGQNMHGYRKEKKGHAREVLERINGN